MDTTDRERVARRLIRLISNDFEKDERKGICLKDLAKTLGFRIYLGNEMDFMVSYEDVGHLAHLLAAGGIDQAWNYDSRLNEQLLEKNIRIEQRLAKASDDILNHDGEKVVRTDSILSALGLTKDSSGEYIRYCDIQKLIDSIRRPAYELKECKDEQTGFKTYVCGGCGHEMTHNGYRWCPDCGARLLTHREAVELFENHEEE